MHSNALVSASSLSKRFPGLDKRLAKILARAGFVSREDVVAAIREGRFVRENRRTRLRHRESLQFVPVARCGPNAYRAVCTWAGLRTRVKSTAWTHSRLSQLSPEQLAIRAVALRAAIAGVENARFATDDERIESESVADFLRVHLSRIENRREAKK